MSQAEKTRGIQTEVKHDILRRYGNSWGGIILGGLSRSSIRKTHFVYIDTNASTGCYLDNQSDLIQGSSSGIVYGSPIIGIEVLDGLVEYAQRTYNLQLIVNSVLVEREPTKVRVLLETLAKKGYDKRVVVNPPNLNCLQHGQIAVYEGDAIALIDTILHFTTSGKKFSLIFIDPYGAGSIPLRGLVGKCIVQERHDVIINFPYLDLHKRSGLLGKDDLPITQEERLQQCDRMFGHNRWRKIAMEIDNLAERDKDRTFSLEQSLVDCYRDTLQDLDPTLAVKSIRMRFPDRERTMYYLFLTTHDPTGALSMNEILWDAKFRENVLRWHLKETVQFRGQLPLIQMEAPPTIDQPSARPATDEIAKKILEQVPNGTLSLKDLFKTLADKPYFIGEINKALTLLKRQNKVVWSGKKLGNRSILAFKE